MRPPLPAQISPTFFDQDYSMTTVIDLNEYSNSGLRVGDKVEVMVRKWKDRGGLEFGQQMEQASPSIP